MIRQHRSPLLAFLLVALLALANLGSHAAPPAEAAAAPTQTVSVRLLPQLAATSTTPQPAATALSTVTATFSPAAPGRAVVLEVRDGRRWLSVARSAQDAAGRVTF